MMRRRSFFAALAGATLAPSLASAKLEEPQRPSPRSMNVGDMIVEELRKHGPDKIVYGWSNLKHDAIQLGLTEPTHYLHIAHDTVGYLERAGFEPKQEFLDQIARAEHVRDLGRPATNLVSFRLSKIPSGDPYFPPDMKAVLASRVRMHPKWDMPEKGDDFRPVEELGRLRTESGYLVVMPVGIEARIIWSWTHEPTGLTLSQTWQFSRNDLEGTNYKIVEYTTSDDMGGTRTVNV